MSKFFITLYNRFEQHKILCYGSLIITLLAIVFFASKVQFEENIAQIFPQQQNNKHAEFVFENLKIKDQIILMVGSKDSTSPDQDKLISVAGVLEDSLRNRLQDNYINEFLSSANNDLVDGVRADIFDHLPIFLTEADYLHFDTLLTDSAIDARMRYNYMNLISPAGVAMKPFIMEDPLGLGSHVMGQLQELQGGSNYTLYDNHVFSPDGSTLLMFLSPQHGTLETKDNDYLITVIEEQIALQNDLHSDVDISYFGGPSVGVYNARQIKKDTILTLILALIVIVVFILLFFQRKASIFLILLPVAFGAVFSLGCIYFITGSISAIAVGAGAAVLGVALSYSIHFLVHQNHTTSVQQLIEELAYPLTIGSITTVGAFVALLFTNSKLLQDFGLFAALTLIGTTIFCLVWLPHFLQGFKDKPQGRTFRFVEKINAYPFDKNKWLVGSIILLFVIGLFTSNKVQFDSNMMNINYHPDHLKEAEIKLEKLFADTTARTMFIAVGDSEAKSHAAYQKLISRLDTMSQAGIVKGVNTANNWVIPQEEQALRMAMWRSYWTPERQKHVQNAIKQAAEKYHLKPETFAQCYQNAYATFDYTDSERPLNTLLENWVTIKDSTILLIAQVEMGVANKEIVYAPFLESSDVVIFDRSYFTNKWVSAVSDDFYLILYFSSFLIFFALLLLYGRLELALLSFLPMAVSWVIIVGLMGIFGIKFNIVNIILTTFIFGIGDDFSIFIMDGLLNRYKTGKQLLNSHKMAIFCAAFTVTVGLGALIFAKHPAMHSLALISLLGMLTVVLVSYTITPILFRLFITNQTEQGRQPYTLYHLLSLAVGGMLFVFSSLLLQGLVVILLFVPIKKRYKRNLISWLMYATCRLFFIITYPIFRHKVIKPDTTVFNTSKVVIANHQSFIDILALLALTPKMVMLTKSWVWKSPIFGLLVRYTGFFCIEDGYENIGLLNDIVKEGYSVAVFPEGSRSSNGELQKFYGGAFYLAELLKLDIVPVVLYGNGMVMPKIAPFNLSTGWTRLHFLPTISASDSSYGETYQERQKTISAYFRENYNVLYATYNNAKNPYYYHRLIRNYIYKGPVLEWYMTVKVKMENCYEQFDALIPKAAKVTDIGCGYGPLCFMLSMLGPNRTIMGIDYDEEKIALAQHAFLTNERINFICANAVQYDLPPSDIFIMNDMLHYMSAKKQAELIAQCASKLNAGGKIIIRDGDSGNKKHFITRLTERISTQLTYFNKTEEPLCFLRYADMINLAESNHLELQTRRNDNLTSNTIYILTPKT